MAQATVTMPKRSATLKVPGGEMTDPRIIVEGVQTLGTNEGWTFTLDITNVGSTPTAITVTVEDEDGTDVTSSVMPSGSPSAPTTTTIKLPKIIRGGLQTGKEYRVITLFTVGDQDPAAIIPIEVVS